MTKKQLIIAFCGDCFHCKDNPQAHHKGEKSFCEREGKYFNHNDALFPAWCPLPDEGKTEREEVLEDIYHQWMGICRQCEHGAGKEQKATMIGFLQQVLDAKLGEKSTQKG